MIEIPDSASENILFRDLQSADAISLYNIYSDKEAMKFRGSKAMESIADAHTFIRQQKWLAAGKMTIRKGVELRANQHVIGSVMYRFDIEQNGSCEIGYSIGRSFWGKGWGTAIVELLVKTAEDLPGISEVIAWSHKANTASVKVLQRNGFVQVKQEAKPDLLFFRQTK